MIGQFAPIKGAVHRGDSHHRGRRFQPGCHATQIFRSVEDASVACTANVSELRVWFHLLPDNDKSINDSSDDVHDID